MEVRIDERAAHPEHPGPFPDESGEVQEVARHERREDEIENPGGERKRRGVSRDQSPSARIGAPQHRGRTIEAEATRHSFVREEAEVPAGSRADVEGSFDRKSLPKERHRRLFDAHELVVSAGRVGLRPERVALVRLEKRQGQNPVVSGR